VTCDATRTGTARDVLVSNNREFQPVREQELTGMFALHSIEG